MRHSYVKILTLLVLAVYITSCSSLPKPISLPTASSLFPAGERRQVLIAFSTEGAISTEFEDDIIEKAILNRLREYWGPSTTVIESSLKPTVAVLLQEAKQRPGSITDIVIVNLTLSGRETESGMIVRDLSGEIEIYDPQSEGLISKRRINGNVSVDNSGPGFVSILSYTVYGVLIGLPLSIVVCLPVSLVAGLTGRDFPEGCVPFFFPSKPEAASPGAIFPIVYSNLVAQIDPSIKKAITSHAVYVQKTQKPPVLIASLHFSDQIGKQPDGVLDAEERAELVIKVENQGEGTAFEVTPQITLEGKGLTIGQLASLGDIGPHQSKEVRVPVEGGTDLGDGKVNVFMEVKEKRGHDTKKEELAFHTAQLAPPDLIVKFVRLDDSPKEGSFGNGNKMLDAGEEAELVVSVENQGKGSAFGVKLNVSADQGGISIGTLEKLGTIPPGGVREVRIPVKGALDLKGGKTTIQILATEERRGFDARRVNIGFDTIHLARPELTIKTVRILDGRLGLAEGNGNGALENGETAELQVFVENRGVGDAYGVHLSLLETIPSGVEVLQKENEIGRIGVNETAKGKVVVRVPRHVKLEEFKARFRVEEVSRKAAESEQTVSLQSGVLLPDLSLAVTWRPLVGEKPEARANVLWANGKTVEGVMTVRNRGHLAAENVELSLSPGNGEIRPTPERFSVGRLEPGQTSIPLRTTVTLPRTYDHEKILLQAVVAQQDFEELTQSIVEPVHLRKPVLVVTQRLLNHPKISRDAIGSVLQGEETTVEIRMRNTGELSAEGVALSVHSAQSDVLLFGKNQFVLGSLPAGALSEPLLVPIRVLRRAPVGPSGLKVEITQEDFPNATQEGMLLVKAEGVEEVEVAGETFKPSRPLISSVPPAAMNPIFIVSHAPVEKTIHEKIILAWNQLMEVSSVEIHVNGKKIQRERDRGIALSDKTESGGPRPFRQEIRLEPGLNTVAVIAYDLSNNRWEDKIQVTRITEQGEIWAVVIGVSRYKNIRSLEFARRDAEVFQEYLRDYIGVPADHIRSLYDEEVTLQSMKSVLGTWLKTKAGIHDTVYIYYAGHGAPEVDSGSPDGDGFEKYLLPTDAEPEDLFATALPMKAVSEIFSRIDAERVVFIVDSCFSGASGGRTMLAARGTRATLSDDFLERLSRGKGRVILSASRANEVSVEGAEYGGGHGVFTYYLLQGLKGKADYSKDGMVDIEEIYRYVSVKVSEVTGQQQTPVKKGEIEGTLIVGRVR